MKHKQQGFISLIIIVVIAVAIIGWEVYAYQKNKRIAAVVPVTETTLATSTSKTNTTSDQIFQEVVAQLGFPHKEISFFRIFGQDKVAYSLGSGITYAYKLNNTWYVAGKGSYQDLPPCSDYASVPDQYNPGCYDSTTNTRKFMKAIGSDGSSESVNYPSSGSVSYIGE